jgi:tRNA(fMet)-specific endonuclease VapC
VFALDTNTLIYFFKGQGNVKQRLLNTAPADILIPSIVLFELEVGILQSTHRSRRRAQLDSLTSTVTVMNFGRHTARRAAEIKATLGKLGKLIGPTDILIAAIAMEHGATLVTHETEHFGRVPGLLLEDWF